MPSVIVLLKSYTPAVLLLSLPSLKLLSSVYPPSGTSVGGSRVGGSIRLGSYWREWKWLELDIEVLQLKSRRTTTCIAEEARGIQMEDIEEFRSKFLAIQLGSQQKFISQFFTNATIIPCKMFLFPEERDARTGWQQKHDCTNDGSFRIFFPFFSQKKVSWISLCSLWQIEVILKSLSHEAAFQHN